jgi:hypothetical protein
MEEQLRDLVRTNGFEPVFTTLKTLVTSEYERAKRDWDFLQTLLKPEPIPVPTQESAATEESEVVEIDTKKISISDAPKVRLPRKAPKTTTA